MNNCILVFSANIMKWGCERSTCSLCDYIQRKGYKVVVVIPKEGPIIELLNEINVDYIISEFSNITPSNHADSGCPVAPSAWHPLTACVADVWYRYHPTAISGTTHPLRAVPTHRYDGTIGAIFSTNGRLYFLDNFTQNKYQEKAAGLILSSIE